MMKHASKGFTLAELLIALAILGVIATFTIPKVLTAAGSSRNASVAKEVASMISGAYDAYKQNTTPTSSTGAGVLTSYWNYVRRDVATTAGAFATPASGSNWTQDCAAATPCFVLHNGATVQFATANTFGGTANTNVLYYNVDPDGTANGAGAATFALYYNGRITTRAVELAEGGTSTGGTAITQIAADPTWIQNWN